MKFLDNGVRCLYLNFLIYTEEISLQSSKLLTNYFSVNKSTIYRTYTVITMHLVFLHHFARMLAAWCFVVGYVSCKIDRN